MTEAGKRLIEAAKEARDKPMRCAECTCENGGEECKWIATPTKPKGETDER